MKINIIIINLEIILSFHKKKKIINSKYWPRRKALKMFVGHLKSVLSSFFEESKSPIGFKLRCLFALLISCCPIAPLVLLGSWFLTLIVMCSLKMWMNCIWYVISVVTVLADFLCWCLWIYYHRLYQTNKL